MNIDEVRSRLKLYGRAFFVIRGIKSIMKRLFGISWETYNLMERTLDEHLMISDFDYSKIKRLEYNDFMKGDKSYITSSKLKIYSEWFKDPTMEAYGIIENDKLIISSWISYKKMFFQKNFYDLPLDSALLLDSWCHIDYRRKGYHQIMTNYRVRKIQEKGKVRAVTLVRKDNIPSIKTLSFFKFATVNTCRSICVGKNEIISPSYDILFHNTIEVSSSVFWDIQQKMDYVSFDQSKAWHDYKMAEKKLPIAYFVDNEKKPMICCWGIEYKYPFIGRILKIDGEAINENVDIADYKSFYSRLRNAVKNKYVFIKLSSNNIYNIDYEIAVRQSGFIRPMVLTACPLSIILDFQNEAPRKKTWNRQLKYAEKECLKFEYVDKPTPRHLKIVCELYDELAKTKGLKERLNLAYLEILLRSESFKLFFVYSNEDKPLAARIVYINKLKSYDWVAANSNEARKIRGVTYYMMECVFDWLKINGVDIFDFGRIGPAVGGANSVYEFKSYSGGKTVSYNGEWICTRNKHIEFLYAIYIGSRVNRY